MHTGKRIKEQRRKERGGGEKEKCQICSFFCLFAASYSKYDILEFSGMSHFYA